MRGGVAFLVYDVVRGCIAHEISDYGLYLRFSRDNSILTIRQGLYALIEFCEYIERVRTTMNRVSDSTIGAFRDESFSKVRAAKSHRGGIEQAKITVNRKLERIYAWLVWQQETGKVPVGTIGYRCLVEAVVCAESTGKTKGRWRSGTRKYPLLFKVQDRNAKHNAPGSVVTDEHMSEVLANVTSTEDPYLAQRNSLFIDIAESAGLRRASICSLTVSQFDLTSIRPDQGEFLVRPSKQKFGYAKTFGIELSLAFRVREFIDNYLRPWISDRKISREIHQDALFLSSKTGKPILERSMSQVVSWAFRKSGFEKGVGAHALRGKFASTYADEELAERRRLGLDTSNRSISAAVALKLGHNDPEQFYRYASSSQAKQARISRDRRATELETLRKEVEALKLQIIELESAGQGKKKRR